MAVKKIELEKKKLEQQKAQMKEEKYNLLELYFWGFVAASVGVQWYYRLWSENEATEIDIVNIVIVSFMIIAIPVLSRTVFGVLPFQLLRRRFKIKKEDEVDSKNSVLEGSEDDFRFDEIGYYNSEEYLIYLSLSSDNLSRKILTRSSSYLFIGSFIAIVGIVYFSFQSIDIVQNQEPSWGMLILFLPRFGALFFIEFVAFFFLKQYRITMDEFKYYESLKRQRESNLLILKMYRDKSLNKDKDSLESISNHLDLFRNPTILGENETTEGIETRKYSNEELSILNNIVDKVGALKKL